MVINPVSSSSKTQTFLINKKKLLGEESGHGGHHDEDSLINRLQIKRDGKSKFVDGIRERQAKMMELNENLRNYNLQSIRDDGLDELKRKLESINTNWN